MIYVLYNIWNFHRIFFHSITYIRTFTEFHIKSVQGRSKSRPQRLQEALLDCPVFIKQSLPLQLRYILIKMKFVRLQQLSHHRFLRLFPCILQINTHFPICHRTDHIISGMGPIHIDTLTILQIRLPVFISLIFRRNRNPGIYLLQT